VNDPTPAILAVVYAETDLLSPATDLEKNTDLKKSESSGKDCQFCKVIQHTYRQPMDRHNLSRPTKSSQTDLLYYRSGKEGFTD